MYPLPRTGNGSRTRCKYQEPVKDFMIFKNKIGSLACIMYACFYSCAYLTSTGCCNGDGHGNATTSGISSELAAKLIQSNTLYQISQEPDYKGETRRFLQRIRSSQNPDQLRGWALEILETHKSAKEEFRLPSEDVPPFIKNLDHGIREPTVRVRPNSYAMIFWGGGFGHWGLIVESEETQDLSGLYTIDWVAGLKAFHDLQ